MIEWLFIPSAMVLSFCAGYLHGSIKTRLFFQELRRNAQYVKAAP